ncbi:MAG TPA: DMT family transporter [Gaiellaceae bacterium]|nr:DMT family transporter [Gaiellaceae bacterium]
MSSGTGLAVAVTLTAGLAGGVQAAVMGELGERVGIVAALAFATLVSMLLAVAILTVWERSFAGIRAALDQPVWLWVGGVMGLYIVLAITIASPRIGVAATIGFVIAGNLVMAAAIDRWGLLGQDEIAFTWHRVLGLALLAAGSALTLRT